MIVGVSAEPVWDSCGPGNFLIEGLKCLANMNPDWTFHVVARARFADAYKRVADTPGVIFHVWDESPMLNRIMKNRWMKGREELVSHIGRRLPFRRWRASLGDVKSIWDGLPALDAIWVPHFDFCSRRWPILYHNGFSADNILLTIHDLQIEFFPDDWTSEQLINYRDGFVRLAESCACIVTHAEFQKKGIQELLGISETKINVVQLPPITDRGILLGKYEGEENVAYANGYKQPYFLYPGSISNPIMNNFFPPYGRVAARPHPYIFPLVFQ